MSYDPRRPKRATVDGKRVTTRVFRDTELYEQFRCDDGDCEFCAIATVGCVLWVLALVVSIIVAIIWLVV